MEREVIYLPHPVSPEEKAKHQKAGKKIVDIRFAPKGYVNAPVEEPVEEPVATPEPENSVIEKPAPKRRRGRPSKKAD